MSPSQAFVQRRRTAAISDIEAVADGLRELRKGRRPLRVRILEFVLAMVLGQLLYEVSPEFRGLVRRQVEAPGGAAATPGPRSTRPPGTDTSTRRRRPSGP